MSKKIKLGYEVGTGKEVSEEKVLCSCGCGQLRPKYDKEGKERKYIWGHMNRFKKGQHPSPKTEFKKGHKLSLESEMKRRKNLSIGRQGMKFIMLLIIINMVDRKQFF